MLSTSLLRSQSVHPVQHTLQLSTSDNSAVLIGVTSLYANPASAANQEEKWQFTLSGSNRFNTDIRNLSGGFTHKLDNGSIGFLIGQYGIDEFNENQISLSYSRRIGKMSYLGIQGHFHQLQIEGLSTSSNADISVGLWHTFSDKIILSAYVKNPTNGIQKRDRVQGKAELSLAYLISSKLTIYSALEKPWTQPISFRPGLSYAPSTQVNIYVSTNSRPSSMSFGIGLKLANRFVTNIGMNTHPILGSSLSLSVGYRIQ